MLTTLAAGFFWLLFQLTPASPPTDCADQTLSIRVENITAAGGHLWVGIYDSPDNFLIQELARVEGFEVTSTGNMQLQIPNLAAGKYALAIFHDENNNGTLDQGTFGIPQEPYVFSRKPKSKWRAPRFEEVAVDLKECDAITLRLDGWW